MEKKTVIFIIAILVIVAGITLFVLPIKKNVDKPYSSKYILNHLKTKYNEDFIIKYAEDKGHQYRRYLISPKSNPEIEFVLGDFPTKDLQLKTDRIIGDSYKATIVKEDLENVEKMFNEYIGFPGTEIEEAGRYGIDRETGDIPCVLKIQIDSYEDIPKVSKKVLDLTNYFNTNLLYANAKPTLYINSFWIRAGYPTLEELERNFTEELLKKY